MTPANKAPAYQPPVLKCGKGEYEVQGTFPGEKRVSKDGKRTTIVGDSEVRFCTSNPKSALKMLKGGKITKSPQLTKEQSAARKAFIADQMKGTMVDLLETENKKAPPAPTAWGQSKPPIDKGQQTRAAGKPGGGKPIDSPAKKAPPQKTETPKK